MGYVIYLIRGCNFLHDISTVDLHLSGILVSGFSDNPDWVVIVQLKCFAESVRFIRVFKFSSL